jgi:hypothetical protein
MRGDKRNCGGNNHELRLAFLRDRNCREHHHASDNDQEQRVIYIIQCFILPVFGNKVSA